jgi:hypothetical protein
MWSVGISPFHSHRGFQKPQQAQRETAFGSPTLLSPRDKAVLRCACHRTPERGLSHGGLWLLASPPVAANITRSYPLS